MDNNITIINIIKKHPDIILPEYATEHSAGMDIRAYIPTDRIIIEPREWASIPTGLCIEVPVGMEVQIRPRSGLAFNHGVTVLNAPGTIDSDYRGEIHVALMNHNTIPFFVLNGDRIAQMVLAKVERACLYKTDKLSNTSRGEGGFGSTGVK